MRATAFLSLSSLDKATQVLNRLQDRTGGGVEAFEYMPRAAVDVICKVFPDIRPPPDAPAETGLLVEVASSRKDDAETLMMAACVCNPTCLICWVIFWKKAWFWTP